MSAPVADKLTILLDIERKRYSDLKMEEGCTATGFRDYITQQREQDRAKYDALQHQALMEAAKRCWEKQPRRTGPNLFSIAGVPIPEYLTRPSKIFEDGQDIENDAEQAFEKVGADFATVNDLYDDATIKMRKAAQSSGAAEKQMRVADEANKRAKGNKSAHLKDLADKKK